jgi:hypothetical protein
MSHCGEWRDIDQFHYRTPKRDKRSSRCKRCAAKAQRDLRKRKLGKMEKGPGMKYGIELPELPIGARRQKAS